MAGTTRKPHVLIVGGGLGGPTLAQALRKQGITFDIFERDNSDMARSQGWAVLLSEQTINDFNAAFLSDLPPVDVVDQLHEHNIPSGFAMYDLSNGQAKKTFGLSAVRGPRMIRANRARLRKWLMTNIDVHWNKRLSHYEEDADGVTAHFEDGTSYRGDVLVGADGINSRIRNQLLPDPDIRPKHVAMGIVLGEVVATKEQYEHWLGYATSFFVGFAGDQNRRMVIAMKGIAAHKQSAEYYWMYGWKDPDAAKEDYWTRDASTEELRDYVLKSIGDLDEGFTEALRVTKAEGMLHPPLRLSDMTPPELPRGRVTLMGDAVHPMTPFRGQGANMAMADGLSLAKVLIAGNAGPFDEILKSYEAEMRPRGTEAVLASRDGWN